jgi:hypothetical protein
MQKTPPKGEASHGRLPSFTPANLSLSTMRAQLVASRYALSIETAAIVAALAFGGLHHG